MKGLKMSQSPATPNQAGKVACNNSSADAVVPLINAHASSTSNAKQSTLYEPSPASTYGDTAIGDSSPMTPQEVRHNGTWYFLFINRVMVFQSSF